MGTAESFALKPDNLRSTHSHYTNEDFLMRLISFALLTFLAAPVAHAAPTQEDVAAARLAYIEGDYDAALKVIQEGA